MARTVWHRLACVLVGLLLGCGGGGGGSDTQAPTIQARLAVFPAGGIPAPVMARGGTSVLNVRVSDPGSGEPTSAATVQANGRALTYDAGSRSYRAYLELSTGEGLELVVNFKGVAYGARTQLATSYPQLLVPRPRDNFARDQAVTPDALRGLPLHMAWSGQLARAGDRWAVLALNAHGERVWPADDDFALLDGVETRTADLPSGLFPNFNVGYVAVGISRETPMVGAAPGSSLRVASLVHAEVFSVDANRGSLERLAVAPGRVAVGVQRQLRLAARGYFSSNGSPHSMQEFSDRVEWSSDRPDIAVVDSRGLLHGVAPGVATITVRAEGRSGTLAVRVLAAGGEPAAGDASSIQLNSAHTGVGSAGVVPASLPSTPVWSTQLPRPGSYPLIADGKVLVVSHSNVDDAMVLHAFDAATGSPAWPPVAVSPFFRVVGHALEGRRIVTVASDCEVRAFDLRDGTASWSQSLHGQVDHVWSCGGQPTVRNGIVYIVGSGVDASLIALDAATGALLWARRYQMLGGGSAPTVTADAVYLSSRLQAFKLDAYLG